MLVQTVCRLGIVEAESVVGELVDALNNVCCADGLSFHIFHKVLQAFKAPFTVYIEGCIRDVFCNSC